jgi:hypothetical protein
MRRPASLSRAPRRPGATRSAKASSSSSKNEELETIEIESTHTIDIDSFVPRQEIDRRFFDAAYYITPNEPVGHEAFAVIREAMRRKALVALGRIVLSKRERVMALDPCERGLIGTTLRYPYEVRDAKNYFEDIPDLTPAPELLRLAEHILESSATAMSGKASPIPACRRSRAPSPARLGAARVRSPPPSAAPPGTNLRHPQGRAGVVGRCILPD